MSRATWGVVSNAKEQNVDYVALDVEGYSYADLQQTYQAFTTGPGPRRDSIQGLTPFKIASQIGGVVPTETILPLEQFIVNHVDNEGRQMRPLDHDIIDLDILPFALLHQASIQNDESIASAVANGYRAHAWETDLGSSTGKVLYIGLQHKLYRVADNTSDPTLEVADTMGDIIRCMGETCTNIDGTITRVLAVFTDGATASKAGAKYTTDPTGSITWGNLWTQVSGDVVEQMAYMPSTGPGITVYHGIFNTLPYVGYLRCTDAVGTLPSPVPSGSVTSTPEARPAAQYKFPGTLASSSANGGTVAWSSPSNAAALDGSYASIASGVQTGVTTEMLRASNFGFDIPTDAILGIEAMVSQDFTASSGSHTPQLQLVGSTGSLVGAIKGAAGDIVVGDDYRARFWGGEADLWGRIWTAAEINDSDFGVGYWLQGSGNSTGSASVDAITLRVYYLDGENIVAVTRTARANEFVANAPGSGTPGTDNWPFRVPSNVRASDGSKASAVTTGTGKSTALEVHGLAMGVPLTARRLGTLVSIERSEAASDDNVYDVIVSLMRDLSVESNADNKARVTGTASHEWETTDTTYIYGSALDDWGYDGAIGQPAAWTVKDWNADGFGVYIEIEVSGAGTAAIDYVTVTCYYQLPSGILSFPTGGVPMDRNPQEPARLSLLAPKTAGASGRELWHVDIAWDASSDQPVYGLSQPNEGMGDIWHACSHQGGYALVGSDDDGPGIYLKILDGSGLLHDYKLLGYMGGYTLKANAVMSLGVWLLLEIFLYNSNGAFADRQWCWYRGGRFHFDFIRQSLSGQPQSAASVPWGIYLHNSKQNQIYTLYPKGSDVGVSYQFLPPKPGDDPRVVYADQQLTMAWTNPGGGYAENTGLAVTYPKVDAGNEELLKTMLRWVYQGEKISAADGAHGSVTWQMAVNGASFTSPAAEHEFTASQETFDLWLGADSAGKPYKYLQLRSIMTHEAGTAKTPNGMGFLAIANHQVEDAEEFILWCRVFEPNFYVVKEAFKRIKRDLGGIQPLAYGPYVGEPDDPDEHRELRPLPCEHRGFIWPRAANGVPERGDALGPDVGFLVGVRFASKPGTTLTDPN